MLIRKAQPTQSDVHVDTLLSNASVAFSNADFIADQLFPVVPVQKQTNIIPWVNQSAFFRNDAKLRAPGTKSVGSGFSVLNTTKYSCDKYSFRHEIPDEVRANTDDPYNQDVLSVKLCLNSLSLNREVAFATNLFTTSVWGTDKTGGTDFTVWSNYGGSSPVVDILAQKDTIQGTLGMDPNVFVMGRQVWTQLRFHPDFIDAIKYTQTGKFLGVDLFSALTELDKVYVGSAIYTTSPEGTAEASVTYTRVWGKHALLMFVPPSPSILTPAAGYTFVWTGGAPGVGGLYWIKRMRDEFREVDIIEANSFYHQKALVTKAGLFFSGAVA